MLIDGRTIASGELLKADICVIGAGAAGITICKELQSSGFATILLEAGGMKREEFNQSLYDGESLCPAIHAPPSMYRQRRFGGSTTIWGGRCVPLDRSDFSRRSWLPSDGWPFSRADIDPYYQRAMPYFEAGDCTFEEREALADYKPLVEGLRSDLVGTNTIERFSAPTDFGKVHGAGLLQSDNLKVIIQASCLGFVRSLDSPTVAHINCCSGQKIFRIEATTFVLASGGLESTRLLLASRSADGQGLGNANDLLGRNYMCHLEGCLAALRLKPNNRPIVWGFERAGDGAYVKRRFQISEQALTEQRLLNIIFRLHHGIPADHTHGNPVLSAMFLVKQFIIPEYRRKVAMIEYSFGTQNTTSTRRLMGHILNIIRGAPDLARFAADWLVRRHLRYRRIPYVALRSRDGVYPLDFNAEQSPNPDSRVFLSEACDPFGVPKLVVDWRLAEDDIRSIVTGHLVLAKAISESGVGEIEFFDKDIESAARRSVPVGGHHIGTTRMDRDPSKGVVDDQCRLHEASNVYVASSSVFPTSGNANPTLTIVALAIRIADHIKWSRSAQR